MGREKRLVLSHLVSHSPRKLPEDICRIGVRWPRYYRNCPSERERDLEMLEDAPPPRRVDVKNHLSPVGKSNELHILFDSAERAGRRGRRNMGCGRVS